jgi:hypothetical protein
MLYVTRVQMANFKPVDELQLRDAVTCELRRP